MTQIQMNYLLSNDEAEAGLNSKAEDLGKLNLKSCNVSAIDLEEEDG